MIFSFIVSLDMPFWPLPSSTPYKRACLFIQVTALKRVSRLEGHLDYALFVCCKGKFLSEAGVVKVTLVGGTIHVRHILESIAALFELAGCMQVLWRFREQNSG